MMLQSDPCMLVRTRGPAVAKWGLSPLMTTFHIRPVISKVLPEQAPKCSTVHSPPACGLQLLVH